jgi:hypothetical protein
LRNIFDQYSQPENRVTHALLTGLNEDRVLLRKFLQELIGVKLPCDARKLFVLEQKYPSQQEVPEELLGERGVPDGWIFDDEDWCVILENKIISRFSTEQIVRHRRAAAGYKTITVVALLQKAPKTTPAGIKLLEWRQIYSWLVRHASSSVWAERVAEYLEIAESKLISSEQFVEGSLTMFSGFKFGHDNPFSYLEGKRVLKLATNSLRGRNDLRKNLGVNPNAQGRGAIKGSQGTAVWDYLSLSPLADDKNFRSSVHLTLSILSDAVEAMVTLPNSLSLGARKNLIELGEDGFQELVHKIVANLKPLVKREKGVVPWFRGVQRRYPSMNSDPFLDARIEFDLRTALPSSGPPKEQKRWLAAAYGAFVNKQNTNYQIQVGVRFPYDRCPGLRRPDVIDMIAEGWLACKPLCMITRSVA